MKKKQILRFGLPKGSLQDATIEKMAKAGYNISVSSRSYIPYVDDEELEIRMIRAQEISRYVEHGYLDCGITGYDWIQENGSKVHEVGEFQFSKVTRQPTRWVLAVPENSPIKSVKDLRGKRFGKPGHAVHRFVQRSFFSECQVIHEVANVGVDLLRVRVRRAEARIGPCRAHPAVRCNHAQAGPEIDPKIGSRARSHPCVRGRRREAHLLEATSAVQ